MRAISKRTYILYGLMAIFFVLLSVFLFQYLNHNREWATKPSNRHLYPTTTGVFANAGQITDRKGIVLAKTTDGKRVYAGDRDVRRAMLHTVGDTERFINTSVQKQFLPDLVGFSLLEGYYRNEAGLEGNSVELTVDSKISEAAYKALGSRKGCVGVMNYETGELLCTVSTPTFDPENKPDVDGDKNGAYTGVYMNRLLSAKYPPGSTFKLITAAAAIDNVDNVKARTFDCKGSKTYDGEKVICNAMHGKISFDQALSKSCNVAFADLAVEMGADVMTEYAKKAGFGRTFSLDGIETAQGAFDLTEASKGDIGWSGIGQYTVLANPYQMLLYVGAIANDGLSVEPYLVQSIHSPLGIPLRVGVAKRGTQMLRPETARELHRMMRNNVKSEYKSLRFGGLSVCAKTGTAEVGGGQKSHSWFVGFVEDENLPLAFVVVAENSGSGIGTAGPIAAKVLAAAK